MSKNTTDMTSEKITSWPIQLPHLIAPLTILLLSLCAYVFENTIIDTLVYQRDLLLNGELWRLFTGHFFHTNVNHLILNMAGLILLWSLHGQYYTPAKYFALFVFSALAVSLSLLFFSPSLQQYVGLSGILHAVFIWGALTDIQHKLKSGYLLLIAIIAKVIYEQLFGASPDTIKLINANVAIDAHLWGCVSGVVFWFSTIIARKFYKS